MKIAPFIAVRARRRHDTYASLCEELRVSHIARLLSTNELRRVPLGFFRKWQSNGVHEFAVVGVRCAHSMSSLSFFTYEASGIPNRILNTEDVLIGKYWLLCITINDESKMSTDGDEFLPIGSGLARLRCVNPFHQYTCEVQMPQPYATRYPPYVNRDRDELSIGGSSWAGNLVSWFQSGISTRIRYGMQAGLYPDEDFES